MASPPVRTYTIDNIKSKLLRPALTSHYVCDFTPPISVINWLSARDNGTSVTSFSGETFDSINKELLQLSCCDASLPGSSLMTNEINDDYHGVSQKHAYRRLYDDRADFTFYVDRNYKIISFFEGWLSYIAGEEGAGGRLGSNNYSYRVKFPEFYKTRNLYIVKFERDIDDLETGRSLEYQFINAFPISITSMPVNYDQSQLLKCTVSFSYERYIVNKIRVSEELQRALIQQRFFEEDNRRGARAAAAGRGLEDLNRANLEAFRRENPGVDI